MEPHQLSSSPTDAELFEHYFAKRKANGGAGDSFDELADDFRECKRQFDDLQAKLAEAVASSERGESKPLDLDALFERVDKRLDELGIPK